MSFQFRLKCGKKWRFLLDERNALAGLYGVSRSEIYRRS